MTKRKGHVNMGPLSKRSAATPYVIERHVQFDRPDRIANGMSTDPYTPPAWDVRAGADDHQRFLTKGLRC